MPYSAPSKEQSLVIIECVLLELYRVLVRLYPRQFRQDFAAEMQTVFGDALRSARRNGLWAMLRLGGREVRELPRALVREHWQSVREKEAGMDKNTPFMAGKRDASQTFVEMPAHRWGEILTAMLPFVLLLLVDALPKLLVLSGLLTWETPAMQIVNIILAVLVIGALLVGFYLAWRLKWPVWSATWYLFFAAVPLWLASALSSWLLGKRLNFVINQTMVYIVVLPLVLAVLLYTVTRRDPLRGLLAALPVLYLQWMFYNMESVSDEIQVAVKIPSIALICLAIAFLLRRGNWRTGLFAVLVMNLAVGILFSYAGIYHGGTLPFVAPGPNLVEVARSLIPQYLAMGAILTGPLFALKIRQAGRASGYVAHFYYHLALAGLLMVILANLAALGLSMDSPSGFITSSDRIFPLAAILLGLGAYLLGIFYLYREMPFTRTASGWVLRLLLALLPLAIPLTFMLPFITNRWPVSRLYGIPLLWVLPHALSLSIGLVWLALSVWVVTRGVEAAMPTVAMRQASEALPLR